MIYTYVRMYIHTQTHTHRYTHTHTHARTHTHTRTHTHRHTHRHTHAHTHAHTHTHTHTRTHTHTHAQTSIPNFLDKGNFKKPGMCQLNNISEVGVWTLCSPPPKDCYHVLIEQCTFYLKYLSLFCCTQSIVTSLPTLQ